MSLELRPHPDFAGRQRPVVLAILDGVGFGQGGPDDAWATARTPTLDRLLATCPHTALRAHGTAVGLPSDEDMGNSEVGHNALGAGRVFDQGAKLVEQAIGSGQAFQTEVWKQLCSGRTLHLLGLVSDGNVHSHIDHLLALVAQAAADGVSRLRVHVLTDGRDVERQSALTWVRPLEERLANHRKDGRDYRVASGGGRMHITMDRYEAEWAMVERGWSAHVRGEGRQFASAVEAIETFYAEGKTDDQWLPAFVVAEDGQPVGRIEDGDAVFFFNFRGDRAIEISRAFEDEEFDAFDRGPRLDVYYAGMMQYDGDLMLPSNFLVAPPAIDRTLGEYLVANGRQSFACSETQKYGHVTYFFNGNQSGLIDAKREEYVEVPSFAVPFDQKPWMSAAEITEKAVDALGRGRFDHLRLNYANGDMVGHTGDLEAARIAMEVVDREVQILEAAVRKAGGVLLITADHGNCDEMWMRDKKGGIKRDASGKPMPKTSHTLSSVPFIVCDAADRLTVRSFDGAGIASVGTSVLELCGLKAPDDYVRGLVAPR
ncbi:MAG: 2,3-bisphosphoglycerate-independent phosphoglycerate mutase [Deltaproteobacteria bacterium]|nr:MAG: 2,3-bisphosphoglycerate-independent phosphoglycerate mutase [Deltaproteobacteria bacterium]